MKPNSRTRANQLFADKAYQHEDNYLDLIILCYNLMTPENAGSIIRLAANFGAKEVIFYSESLTMRESKVKKVAGVAYAQVTHRFCSGVEIEELLPDDYQLIGIETADSSVDISDFEIPHKSVLLLGSERYGLPNTLVEKCDAVLHIPMHGKIKSMNVAQACGIALYAATCGFKK